MDSLPNVGLVDPLPKLFVVCGAVDCVCLPGVNGFCVTAIGASVNGPSTA